MKEKDQKIEAQKAEEKGQSQKSAKATAKKRKGTSQAAKIKALEAEIKELQSKLEEAERARKQAEDKMLRVVAEYENARKRQERELQKWREREQERLVRGLLPLIDNLERSARFEEDDGADKSDGHKAGIKLILDQFRKYLKEELGVEAFDPQGEVFDPELHEAMITRHEEGVEQGRILEVFERGYRMGERIIRHAKVVVSQ